jgi:hypothetical protein
MTTITSDLGFARAGVFAELTAIFFARGGNALAGLMSALFCFIVRHIESPQSFLISKLPELRD